jgi:methionyl-tRNA formyltransferase
MMRIVLIGQAAFAEKVLDELINNGEEIVAVYTIPDAPGRGNTLKELATKLGIPVFQPRRMRDPEVYRESQKLKADLNIMAFVTDIVPENILNFPEYGTIQYHPSLLPKHRGGSSINWAVIQGEAKTGISIFWPDKGLDTGPILMQKEAVIDPDDTVGSLYFDKLFPLGVQAIVESLSLIKAGKAPRLVQDETNATYEGLCTDKETRINWEQPAGQVYNLIRGSNPQPGAHTTFHGTQLKIYDAALLKGLSSQAKPGEITSIGEDGFVIAADGGAVLVKRVRTKGGAKVKAAEFAKEASLEAGDLLGN